jgi:diadenosine tetraphosphate (Ap4A) HIT family hydrolase
MGTRDLPSTEYDPSCAICKFATGAAGTVLYEDDHWAVGVLDGIEAPGWTVVALRRHAFGITGASVAEAETMGPLLRRVTEAIESATGAERVYIAAYGENHAHWHLLLIPRGADVPVEQRHSQIWGHRQSFVDPKRARQVGELIRDQMSSGTRV